MVPPAKLMPEGPYLLVYRIDANDRLCHVNETWRDFARRNGAAEDLAAGALGTLLWSHVEGDSVREIYRRLAERARKGRPVTFSYRCDSPTERRTFVMTIQADLSNGVDFTTELVATESRPSVRLLENSIGRTHELVRVCAWCQRVAASDHDWCEVEEAVNRLRLLHADRLPGITHGMCQDCGTHFAALIKG